MVNFTLKFNINRRVTFTLKCDNQLNDDILLQDMI